MAPLGTPAPERWLRFADDDTCEYCGTPGPCRPDPFGQRPSCWPCFDQIIGGDE